MKTKKSYAPYPYKQYNTEPRCYYDYQENMEEIMSNVEKAGLSNYKFVMDDKFVDEDVCIVDKTLGYREGAKVRLVKVPGIGNNNVSPELRIVNTENVVSPAAIKISTKVATECGYDFGGDIVMIAEV